MCFTLRLHMSATPTRVGLTQALGGEKRSVAVLSATAIHRVRLAVLFGKIAGALPLRPSSQGALTVCMRYVRWLRCLCVLSCGLSVSDAVTSDTSGCRFSGRAQASGLRSFGKCANASPSPASFPPNKSFKPTPHRGGNSVLYATLHAVAAPLWVGLTPALGHCTHTFTRRRNA